MEQAPRIIFWETTKRCNLRCGYCRMLKAGSGSELTTQEALKLVRDIKDAFKSPVLVLSGGEPLLRDDIFEIISFASKIEVPAALATNGTLLGEKEAAALKECGIRRVSISIDSIDEVRHDSSRGERGAFRKTQDAAGILKRYKIPFQINCTITKTNKREMRSVADAAMSLGASAVHYFVLVPVGCGKELEEDVRLDADDIEDALGIIKTMSEELPIEIRPTCAPQYVRFDSHYGGCIAGTGAFFISSEGDIYPCGYLPVKAGSLDASSIKEIWEDSPVFKTLRQNDLKGGCAGCYIKERCRGCRARAYGATGNYLAGDAACVSAKEAAVI